MLTDRNDQLRAGQAFLAIEEAVNLICDGGHIDAAVEELTSARGWLRLMFGLTLEEERRLISEVSHMRVDEVEEYEEGPEYEICFSCDPPHERKVKRHFVVNPADPTDAVELDCGHVEVPFYRMPEDYDREDIVQASRGVYGQEG